MGKGTTTVVEACKRNGNVITTVVDACKRNGNAITAVVGATTTTGSAITAVVEAGTRDEDPITTGEIATPVENTSNDVVGVKRNFVAAEVRTFEKRVCRTGVSGLASYARPSSVIVSLKPSTNIGLRIGGERTHVVIREHA